MSEPAPSTVDDFERRVATLIAADHELTPISAAILLAHHEGIARDSRGFSSRLGVSHALVLREVHALVEERAMLVVMKRNPKTLRVVYDLSESGRRLFGGVVPDRT